MSAASLGPSRISIRSERELTHGRFRRCLRSSVYACATQVFLLASFMVVLGACSGESRLLDQAPKPAHAFGIVNRQTGKIVDAGRWIDGLYREGEALPKGKWEPVNREQLSILIRWGIADWEGYWNSERLLKDSALLNRFLLGVRYNSRDESSVAAATDHVHDPSGPIGFVEIRLPDGVSVLIRKEEPYLPRVPRTVEEADVLWEAYTSWYDSGLMRDERAALEPLFLFWSIKASMPKEIGEWIIVHRVSEWTNNREHLYGTDSEDGVLTLEAARHAWGLIYASKVGVPAELLRTWLLRHVTDAPLSKHIRTKEQVSDDVLLVISRICRAQYPEETWWQTPEVLAAIKAADAAEAASKAPDPEPADSKKD